MLAEAQSYLQASRHMAGLPALGGERRKCLFPQKNVERIILEKSSEESCGWMRVHLIFNAAFEGEGGGGDMYLSGWSAATQTL